LRKVMVLSLSLGAALSHACVIMIQAVVKPVVPGVRHRKGNKTALFAHPLQRRPTWNGAVSLT
jgi:hypothetical protein